MPAKSKTIPLRFPTGGLVKRYGYQSQSPYTTPSALNVWPDDVTEGRERGGMRPGLAKTHAAELGSGNPVRLLASFTWVDTSNNNARVEAAIASANGVLYKETSGNWAAVSTSLTLNADVLLQSAIHNGKVYIADYGLAAQGTNGTNTTTSFDSASFADWTAVGANADDYVLVIESGTGVTAGTYTIASISSGSITLDSSPGASGSGIVFRLERAPKVYDPSADTLSIWTATSGKGTVPNGCTLICNWRGRIVLGGDPVYPQEWYMSRLDDPLDWLYGDTDVTSATAGQSAVIGSVAEPITALIPHANECLLLGHTKSFYVMRGDPMFGGTLNNLSRQIGVLSANAWCKTPEDVTVFMTSDGVYAMDTGCGTIPQSVSRERLPVELLNLDVDDVEVQMAYDLLFRGIHIWVTDKTEGPSDAWWFDWESKSFWPMSTESDFEPTAICNHKPIGTANVSSILLGCRDGYVRSFDRTAGQDDTTNFESYVMYGPIIVSSNPILNGQVQVIQCAMENGSGDVDWSLRASSVDKTAVTKTADFTGTWTDEMNPWEYPRTTGRFATLQVSGKDYGMSANVPWVAPEIVITTQDSGMRRP